MRFRLTFTMEYDVDHKDLMSSYQTSDPKRALEIDVANAKDDPGLMLMMATENAAGDDALTITGEIVEEPPAC